MRIPCRSHSGRTRQTHVRCVDKTRAVTGNGAQADGRDLPVPQNTHNPPRKSSAESPQAIRRRTEHVAIFPLRTAKSYHGLFCEEVRQRVDSPREPSFHPPHAELIHGMIGGVIIPFAVSCTPIRTPYSEPPLHQIVRLDRWMLLSAKRRCRMSPICALQWGNTFSLSVITHVDDFVIL
jgi:hypothetical protein